MLLDYKAMPRICLRKVGESKDQMSSNELGRKKKARLGQKTGENNRNLGSAHELKEEVN